MTDNTTPDTPQAPKRGRKRAAWIVAAVAAVGLTGAAFTGAFSQGMPFGPGHWHGGGGGFHRGFMPFDPARAEERADRMVRHLAIEIDATNDQQERLRAIVKGAVKDLMPMREKVQSSRQRARELLTQPNIDRASIERFRSDQIAVADAFSKRLAQAVGDAAEVLTPEQRQKLSDRLPPHGGPGRMWNRW